MRILFLCMGNICRSPAAHCVFQKLVNDSEWADQFVVDSAGTTHFHAGSSPDARIQQQLMIRGIPVLGRAKQIDRFDLEFYDLILAMDKDNLAYLKAMDTQNIYGEKFKLFCEYCRHHQDQEVPDPYYGGHQGFDYVMELIVDGCQSLFDQACDQLQLDAK